MNFIVNNWYLILLARVSGAMLLVPMLQSGGRGGVSAAMAVQMINREKAVVIDVCGAAEYAAGHVVGAKNVPLNELETRLPTVVKNKGETAQKYGDEQVLVWRRSYDTPPPALQADDSRSERSDPRYANLPEGSVPLTECLKDTVARVMPFWNETMAPAIRSGQRVVVAAHGNSIRALVKYLDNISDNDIVGINIPNGIPLVYELDENLKPLRHYYLGDAEAAAAAAAAVASQGKA